MTERPCFYFFHRLFKTKAWVRYHWGDPKIPGIFVLKKTWELYMERLEKLYECKAVPASVMSVPGKEPDYRACVRAILKCKEMLPLLMGLRDDLDRMIADEFRQG